MIINNKDDIQIKDISKITAWVNHHTASTQRTQFSFVNSLHQKRWSRFKSELGYFGGYNFLIEKDGTIRQYRKVGEELAAHKGHNSTKGAICLAGDLTKEPATRQQEASLEKLYSWLKDLKPVPMDLLHGQLQWNNTSCPGLDKSFYQEIYKRTETNWKQRLITLLRKEIYKILRDRVFANK